MVFNLRCPRNGKTDDYKPEFLVCVQLSSLATEAPEQGLGKAMRVAPSARIPANKVMVRPLKVAPSLSLMHWRGSW